MENSEFNDLWKDYGRKLEENLRLNRQNAEDITKMKVKSLVSSMGPLKLFTLLVGIAWVVFGAFILVNLCISAFDEVSYFFLLSAGIQILLTAVAIAIYINQLILIQQISPDEPILSTQENLMQLKATTLWSARVLFLQLPLWTTFYWNDSMFRDWSMFQWLVQGTVTLLFTATALWLFFNIKYENRHKKWFNVIFSGAEWRPLIESSDLLEQLMEYSDDKYKN